VISSLSLVAQAPLSPIDYRAQLNCSVAQVDDIFEVCIQAALRQLSAAGVAAYLDGASAVCNLGRGQELVLLFLEGMPDVARIAGEAIIPRTVELTRTLSRSGSAKAINPFLSTLPAVTHRLEEGRMLDCYFSLITRMTEQAPAGLVPMLRQVDFILGEVCLGGLKSWIETGIEAYRNHPPRQADYFSLQTQDSRAALMRERHGTLFVDHERRLEQYLRAFWGLEEITLHPYSTAFSELRRSVPHLDHEGFHLPDVYDDWGALRGIDRYRALLAHLSAHRRFTEPFIADNFNRFQHLFIEAFEDSRIDRIAMARYPGLRRIFKTLHPLPVEGSCPPGHSCIRHKAAVLSRALLDPHDHPYRDPILLDFIQRFEARLAQDPFDTTIATDLGVAYLVAVHETDFRSPKVWFKDTEVSYRDDNRYMWIFVEDTDDEDDFHSDHSVSNPQQDDEEAPLFIRHLREWSQDEHRYRPDWVTVHETIAPATDAALIDGVLEKHAVLVKQLKRVVDLLKPQQQVRVRYQEEGDELDLDIALRALIDHRSGATPDPRIHQSRVTAGRDIAVMLLLDLSQSINQIPPGLDSSIRALSQEAVALLAVAVDALGDPLAIAGFASNTRHEVHYLHFKGFSEPWGEEVKGRLAAMEGGLSTRMGAALRTAGLYLGRRQNQKKLLLLLTDGEPHDVDVPDPEYLRHDTKRAVEELANQGIDTYCITLDPRADEYVADLFGKSRFTVIDRVEHLPERLPGLFMALTR